MKFEKSVADYIENSGDWKDSLLLLRELLIATQLVETVKWGAPVYTIDKKNVVGLGAFKSYVGLWFYQGALLQDPERKLINAQEGVTKAMRQWRFQSIEEIDGATKTIASYVAEAIHNQEQGLVVQKASKNPLIIPVQLETLLQADADLQQSFASFTLYKRREFADYISEAKRNSTKQKRLEKIVPLILAGIGLGDKYRK